MRQLEINFPRSKLNNRKMRFIYLFIVLLSILNMSVSRLQDANTRNNETKIKTCKRRCEMGAKGFYTTAIETYKIDSSIPYSNTYLPKAEANIKANYDYLCQCLDYLIFHNPAGDATNKWTFQVGGFHELVKNGTIVAIDNTRVDTSSEEYLKPPRESVVPRTKANCNKICNENMQEAKLGGILFYEHPIIGHRAACKCILNEDLELRFVRQKFPQYNFYGSDSELNKPQFEQDLITDYDSKLQTALKNCKGKCTLKPKLFKSTKGQSDNLICDCLSSTYIYSIERQAFTEAYNKDKEKIVKAINNKELFQQVEA